MGKRKQSKRGTQKERSNDKVAAAKKSSSANPSPNNIMDSMTEEMKQELLRKLLLENSMSNNDTATTTTNVEDEGPKKKRAKSVSSASEAESRSSSDDDDDDDEEIVGDDVCGSESQCKTHMFFCPSDKLFYKTPEDVKKATDRFNKNSKDQVDDDVLEPVGQSEQSPSHMYHCTGDGLFYKTYEDMAKAKKRSNQKHLQSLGLDKASADMKAAVTSSKKKKRPPTKKKEAVAKPPPRRSTRPSIPVIAPPPPPLLPPPMVGTLFEEREENDTSKQSKEENKSSDESEVDDGEEEKEVHDDDEKEEDRSDEKDEESSLETSKADPWTIRYQELKKFKVEKGHCKVPQHYAANPTLGNWVMHQRGRLMNAGKKSEITQTKIEKLNKLGFYWGKPRAASNVPWETRFNELKDHYEIFGDCDIDMKPRYTDCTPLAKWMRTQRNAYHHLKKGRKSSNITKERIQRLNGLGFDWNGLRSLK